MPTQHPKVGSSGSYCWDAYFPAARIFWEWTSHLLAFSARRHWTPHRMLSSRSWSIAVSQRRTVDPTLSQEMWLAVMLSWTAEESMMNKKQFRRHSSPTGAKTSGGASTTNTITPLIYGLSSLIRSPPLQLHMQRHHPTPNQNFQGPPTTYNPHHHTLPSLSKSQSQLHHQSTSNHTANWTFVDTWETTLQRHGLLLRLHGAVWMYNRRFDVATRFHLPQKTWSLWHSDLLSEWDTLLYFPPLHL